MKKILISFILISLAITLLCQKLIFASALKSKMFSYSRIQHVIFDDSNNYYLLAGINDTSFLDDQIFLNSSVYTSYYLTKYNEFNQILSKEKVFVSDRIEERLSPQKDGIVIRDSSLFVYRPYGDLEFNKNNIKLLNVDSSINQKFAIYGNTKYSLITNSYIHRNNINDFYICGMFRDSLYFNSFEYKDQFLKKKHPPNWADLFIAKIDTNYNFSNILHFSPVNDAFLNDLKVDSNQSVYVALNNKGELYFRDSCILGKGKAFSEISSAIIKVKKDGAHEIFKSFEYFNSRDNDIFSQDGIKSMDFDDNGNVYVIAALGNNININANKNKDIYTKVSKESDFFLIKYDNSGNLIWYRQIKHNRRNMSLPKLKIHQNKIFLSIQYNDSINIDKDKWHFSRNYTIDPFSSCILVYDVNNNYVSSINIKSQESLFIGGFDINQNRLVTYGEFIGKADFDPTRATFEVSSTDFTRNGFIAMYDISKLDKNTIEYDTFPKNSSVKLDEETNFFAYPNPFTDELKIDLETFEKDIILDIFDLQSRKVLSQRFQNKKSITLKTDEVSKGSYILKLKTKTYEKDYKVQKE